MQGPLTVQALRGGAPSAMPPLDSHSLSCLRQYVTAVPSACASDASEAQRLGSLPKARAKAM